MRVRDLFRNEAPSAERLVESVEQLASQGLIPEWTAWNVRWDFEDAQISRPGDPPLPSYYKR